MLREGIIAGVWGRAGKYITYTNQFLATLDSLPVFSFYYDNFKMIDEIKFNDLTEVALTVMLPTVMRFLANLTT